MVMNGKESQWRSKFIQPRLRWSKQAMRPAELGEAMMGIMLARDNLLEDANYDKIVPNHYLVELSPLNYSHNYQPIEERLIKQLIGKLLEYLTTTNSRLGRKEYRLGGPLTLEIHPAPGLTDWQARISYCIQPEPFPFPAASAPQTTCLELLSSGERWDLTPGITTIGRNKTCQVHLTHPEIQEKRLVSGQHAYIVDDQQNWRLFDGSPTGKPSTNGTYVNGAAVPPEGRLLQDGDLISLAAVDSDHAPPDASGMVTIIFRGSCS